jgi:hypothetical protein
MISVEEANSRRDKSTGDLGSLRALNPALLTTVGSACDLSGVRALAYYCGSE